MSLDIERILQDIGVTYYTQGKNISDGWIGIGCPFCADDSTHCGLKGYSFSCWKCGSKGSIKKLLKQLHPGTWGDINALFDKYNSSLFISQFREKYNTVTKVEWPEHCTTELPDLHKNYLIKRGYDPQQLQNLYDVRAVYQLGAWCYRLIIPIYIDGILVSYVGRDVTEKSSLKYKNLSKEKSIIPVKKLVFNIDAVDDFSIICEGITDSWRFGSHGVALFGLQFTAQQINTLSKKLKRAVVFFDNEPQAQAKADELAEALSMTGVQVEIAVHPDFNDPGEIPQNIADEIKLSLL